MGQPKIDPVEFTNAELHLVRWALNIMRLIAAGRDEDHDVYDMVRAGNLQSNTLEHADEKLVRARYHCDDWERYLSRERRRQMEDESVTQQRAAERKLIALMRGPRGMKVIEHEVAPDLDVAKE